MPQKFATIADALQWAEQAFIAADLFYGHGTENAWDDAVAIVLHVLNLPVDSSDEILRQKLTPEESQQLADLFSRRIVERIPTSYLTHTAWFCGLEFYVDERVIIPRSPIAELIADSFQPWIESGKVKRILDLCCGSACIAIACAYAFPEADIDAVDISTDALEVAKINVTQHQLNQRVHLYQSDLFSALGENKYDIIASNPPYVDHADYATMPAEYQHEPKIALRSGQDGLDATRRILAAAYQHLNDTGILVAEVGNSAIALERTFPKTAFTWLSFANGGDGVFLMTKQQLEELKE